MQETWYTKQDLQHFNDVHPDCHGTAGVSTIDSRDGPIYGHPPGGVCIMWRGKCVLEVYPESVGGVSGKDDIADVWLEHFDKLFNCIQDDDVNTRMITAEYSADIIVTADEVVIAIRKLSTGKSSGLDGIYAEHLLHCRQRFITMLAMCFTRLFVHGFLPDSLLEIVLVPVIKDKTGRIDQVDKYTDRSPKQVLYPRLLK